jgi:hypothetical protein
MNKQTSRLCGDGLPGEVTLGGIRASDGRNQRAVQVRHGASNRDMPLYPCSAPPRPTKASREDLYPLPHATVCQRYHRFACHVCESGDQRVRRGAMKGDRAVAYK